MSAIPSGPSPQAGPHAHRGHGQGQGQQYKKCEAHGGGQGGQGAPPADPANKATNPAFGGLNTHA
jgi:hypothetical protein